MQRPENLELEVLYQSRNAGTVRLATGLSLACAAVCLMTAYYLFQTLSFDSVDAELAPTWMRAGYATAVSVAGLGFAVYMWLYGRRYIVEMVLQPGGTDVRLTTLWGLGFRELALRVGEFGGWVPHGTPATDDAPPAGPLLRVTVRGEPRYLLDLRAEIPDWPRLDDVLNGRTPRQPL